MSIAPSYIRFLTAAQWGRVLIHSMSPERLNDPETYVHHTAGNPARNRTAEYAMRDLQALSHRKGYATVAYDVVVHRAVSGVVTVMEGRGAARSAATLDRNEEGEAICLMGYFHPGHSLSEQPTDRDLDGIAWGIAWMMEQGWSATDTRILGHRDNPAHPNATSCPGDYLYAKLPEIRRRVAQITAPTPPPPPIEGGHSVFQKMIRLDGQAAVFACYSGGYKTWVPDMATYNFLLTLPGVNEAEVIRFAPDIVMKATGPILGERPPGCDAWGNPK